MKILIAWGLALSAGFATHAQAAYPEKPITLIVAYAPGGGTDLTARAIAPFIETYLGSNARFETGPADRSAGSCPACSRYPAYRLPSWG
jgi:tripartite-type tricarboxylate transporter receptor subunit TctC